MRYERHVWIELNGMKQCVDAYEADTPAEMAALVKAVESMRYTAVWLPEAKP